MTIGLERDEGVLGPAQCLASGAPERRRPGPSASMPACGTGAAPPLAKDAGPLPRRRRFETGAPHLHGSRSAIGYSGLFESPPGGNLRFKPLLLALAILTTAGCSSAAPTPTATEKPAAQITSAPGDTPGSIVVLKNYFFNNYKESCDDWSLSGSTSEYLTYGECPHHGVYFWMFDDSKQRDALLPEIQKKGMPLLVSDKWVIASNMDLKPAQKDIGGAINP